jgi:hypothetical protein
MIISATSDYISGICGDILWRSVLPSPLLHRLFHGMARIHEEMRSTTVWPDRPVQLEPRFPNFYTNSMRACLHLLRESYLHIILNEFDVR